MLNILKCITLHMLNLNVYDNAQLGSGVENMSHYANRHKNGKRIKCSDRISSAAHSAQPYTKQRLLLTFFNRSSSSQALPTAI